MPCTWLVALALSLALLACGGGAKRPTSSTAGGSAGAPAQQAGDPFSRIPQVVERVQPSIVTILAGQGVGSGVIYRSDGTILTNAHVVGQERHVMIAFADGRRDPGGVLATDPDTDLAVIRVDRTGLPAASLQPRLPVVGAFDVVLGSPLGFEKTVTAGIISGLHRSIPGSAAQTRSLVDLIQTDAPISPGNSGGAVVDLSGQVVGISEAYIPPEQGAVAIGFAIPAATATQVADQLIAHGRAAHAYLGVQPAPITPQIAQELGVGNVEGVLLYGVTHGGSAARAGLRAGDIVTAIGGVKTPSVEELFAALRQRRPGESVEVDYHRVGQTHKATVKLSDTPS